MVVVAQNHFYNINHLSLWWFRLRDPALAVYLFTTADPIWREIREGRIIRLPTRPRRTNHPPQIFPMNSWWFDRHFCGGWWQVLPWVADAKRPALWNGTAPPWGPQRRRRQWMPPDAGKVADRRAMLNVDGPPMFKHVLPVRAWQMNLSISLQMDLSINFITKDPFLDIFVI